MLSDLQNIEELLLTNNAADIIRKLNKDRNSILYELYKIKNNIDNSIIINEELIKDLIYNNYFFKLHSNSFKIPKKEKKIDVLNIFDEFMKKDTFGLKDIYDEMICRGGIKYIKERTFYLGSTFYIESLKKNYIKICESNDIEQASTLIHELGHAKMNLQPKKIEYEYTSNLGEMLPLFLELQFLDFIKEYDLKKTSYNAKLVFLKRVVDMLGQLYDELATNKDCIKNKYVIYKIKAIIGYLLSFKLYNMYLIDEEKSIYNINQYVKNFGNMSDDKLLESMDLNTDLFKNNSILREFNNILDDEKKLILNNVKK